MSLYGALFSGVSGLAAQSSAMGSISDNISNVNTIGYKGTKVAFSTLVTHQTSETNYSPGGVQSKPRTGVSVQGLLQASNSSTDVALSGQGFFIVNQAAHPVSGNQFAYTRAGSFTVDKSGYLTNTSGWYMQGWPLANWDQNQQASLVKVGNETFMKSYKDSLGKTVYVNDNIVNAQNLQPLNLNDIAGTAAQTRNIRMGANLPNDASVGTIEKQPLTIYDSLGGDGTIQFSWNKTSQNNWDLEAIPPEGARSLTLRNQTTSGNVGNVYGAMGRMDFRGLPAKGGAVSFTINDQLYRFNVGSGTDGSAGTLGTAYTFSDGTTTSNVTNYYTTTTDQSTSTFVNDLATDVNKAFHVQYDSQKVGTTGTAFQATVNGVTFNTATDLDSTATVNADTLNSTVAFTDLGLKAAEENGNLYIYSENKLTFGMSLDGGTTSTSKTTDGIVYCEQLSGTNSLVFRQYDAGNKIQVDSSWADDGTGNIVQTLDSSNNNVAVNKLLLTDGTPATMQNQDLQNPATFTVAAASEAAKSAIVFNGDGTPQTVNVHYAEIDWANGSTDMSGDSSINLFLGNNNVSDGMTQLNGAYQLTYSSQDGAKFGNFSGVTVDNGGVVTALFDNGVTRPVFQIPVATFVNPDGMSSLSGNVFISTDFSGDPTLRQAGNAGAGQVNGSSLESSTVDIGSEFTTMIVTQRAYSAAAKIITTADQMLDDLINIKR